jgi:hypothetical protein
MAWEWSWAFLVTVQRLTTWAIVRRRCEVLVRNGVRIRAHNLKTAVYYSNMLNVKYLSFLHICAFCTIIYCHPFIFVKHTQLIMSSVTNFMTIFSSFNLRCSGHSQICLKPICATGISYIPTFSSDWIVYWHPIY